MSREAHEKFDQIATPFLQRYSKEDYNSEVSRRDGGSGAKDPV